MFKSSEKVPTQVSTKISTENIQTLSPITKKILENLVDRYPNYKTNSLVLDQMILELDSLNDKGLFLNSLPNYPLEILDINPSHNGNMIALEMNNVSMEKDEVLIHFHTENSCYAKSPYLSNHLQFDVIGVMNSKLAAQLNEESKYKVFGEKWHKLSLTEMTSLVKRTMYGWTTDIRPDYSSGKNEGKGYNCYRCLMGIYLVKIDSVQLIQ
tara:strand:- start:56 stop:688 length:633 start_codon:yes stop_codon:yes gene_type:complete